MIKFIIGIITIVHITSISYAEDKVSEQNREGLQYQIVGSILGGAQHSFTPNPSLEASYFKDKNTVISLRFNKYNEDLKDLEEPISYQGQVIQLAYKEFNGNSFYYRPSIFFREMSIQDTEDADYVFRDLGVGYAIGNQWQWENFTLGCDWIGANIRASILYYEDTQSSEVLFRLRGYGLTLDVLNFYLGVSF